MTQWAGRPVFGAAPPPIILDGDPGHDDEINIMLALTSPEFQVLGLTTAFGNVGLNRTAHTTRNALTVREPSGVDVPSFAGADRPLVSPRISAEAAHGDSGMDGPLATPTRGAEAGHAARFVIGQVRARPGEITLVPTGPLTTLALASHLALDTAALIRGGDLAGRRHRHRQLDARRRIQRAGLSVRGAPCLHLWVFTSGSSRLAFR